MKKFLIHSTALLTLCLIVLSACKKEEDDKTVVLPTVTTADVTNIQYQTAKCGGTITDDGNGDITARGVVYGTTTAPTVDNAQKTSDGTGSGTFESNITGLAPAGNYFVRAYATNSAGTAYGAEKTFTTLVK